MDQAHTEPVGESWKLNPDYNRAADFLGISINDRQDYKTAQKIAAIHDYFEKKTGKKEITAVLNEMAKLQKTIGYSGIGKSLADQLYQTVRVKQDTERLQKPVEVKPKKETQKTSPIQSVVNETVNKVVGQTVNDMVKKVLSDKKALQGAVAGSVQQALKGALK